MDRESIIAEVARTLFVMAWADGVESGEIAGEGPGAGGDWMDAAPVAYAYRVTFDGGREPIDAQNEDTARALFDGRCARMAIVGNVVKRCEHTAPWGASARVFDDAEACRLGRVSDGIHLRRLEVPDPDALAEARRIVDAFDAAARASADYRECYGDALASFAVSGMPPVEVAQAEHEDLSETDRFAHCLAMQALGSGVGLEDDIPSPPWRVRETCDGRWMVLDAGVQAGGAVDASGAGDLTFADEPTAYAWARERYRGEGRLPGWIRASVCSSDFGAHSLDGERYPRNPHCSECDEVCPVGDSGVCGACENDASAESVRGCSCGMADYGAPGHDGHEDAGGSA